MTEKAALRSNYLAKRKKLNQNEIDDFSKTIADRFRHYFSSHPAKNVHVFLPIKKHNEVNTWPILDFLKAQNIDIIVSKSDFSDNSMTHIRYVSETEVKSNGWGIPEPSDGQVISTNEIEMVLVPLVIFDQRGYRIGYGKGFYDKFLSECQSTVIKVGLSIFEPVEMIDRDDHDVRLDLCITPTMVHTFQ